MPLTDADVRRIIREELPHNAAALARLVLALSQATIQRHIEIRARTRSL